MWGGGGPPGRRGGVPPPPAAGGRPGPPDARRPLGGAVPTSFCPTPGFGFGSARPRRVQPQGVPIFPFFLVSKCMVLTSQFEQGDREDHFPRRQFYLFIGLFFSLSDF